MVVLTADVFQFFIKKKYFVHTYTMVNNIYQVHYFFQNNIIILVLIYLIIADFLVFSTMGREGANKPRGYE